MEPPSKVAGERGHVLLIVGCMFSGKTTALIHRLEKYPAEAVLCVKHVIDTRYAADAVVTHAGRAIPARAASCARDIVQWATPHLAAVAIDEAHFFDDELVSLLNAPRLRRLDVILTSLEPDSWGAPFPINHRLRKLANEFVSLRTACARCGREADRTQRLTPVVSGQMVVDPSNYEPRCRTCWRPPVVAGACMPMPGGAP